MPYCLYLRKSRADTEAEERGEGETLARHEKILLELAKKLRLSITQIYKEIVSGETIAARPVMQQLLHDVESGNWDGVLVVEVERLARGDTIDQGIVAQTFKYSGTQIITPVKTYDPNNEFDEEYFEFGLFMSRREYKTINRRLQNGRIASVKDGKYVGNKAPYGYKRVKLENDKGYTLESVDEQADVIRLIYEWYTVGEKQPDGTIRRLGTSLIARRLNEMKIPSKTGKNWTVASIRDILINPVYIGKVRWNWRPAKKKIINGQVKKERPRNSIEQCIVADGLHPAIIQPEIFYKAQELIKKNPPAPVGARNVVKNPLAGIVVCGKCGHNMVRRPYNDLTKKDTLMCSDLNCNNVSSALCFVENGILKSLQDWLTEYKLKWDLKSDNMNKNICQSEITKKALNKLQDELDTLCRQLNKTYDLLEQGVYDTDTFLERSGVLSQKIANMKNDISTLKTNLETELAHEKAAVTIIPKVEKLLEVYRTLPTAKEQNDMLKEVLEKVVYKKEKSIRWHGSHDDFELVLYPRIPLSEHKKK